MDRKYKDILLLPHPEPKERPRMPKEKRAAQFMPFAGRDSQLLPQTSAPLRAVFQTPRRSVITGGDHMSVLYDDRAHLPAQTSGTSRCQHSEIHEILIPAGSAV